MIEKAMIITGFVCAALGIILVFMFNYWREFNGDNFRIKFCIFKGSYEIDPDKWILDDDEVTYELQRDEDCDFIDLSFGFIDFYRYQHWHKSLEQRNRDKENQKDFSDVMNDIKKTYGDVEVK